MSADLREEVRERYAEAALGLAEGQGCGCDCESIGCCGDEATTLFGKGLYDTEVRSGLPEDAVTASLGCGNPLAVTALHEGETVLDLGSGGGIDVLLSARRVGPKGTVYGLDMTDEMLALARRNAAKARATNVHFLKGLIEAIPLPAESVDVVISNCVVNLSTDKRAVYGEIQRVLRPGGRVGSRTSWPRTGSLPKTAPSAEAMSVASPGRSPRRSIARGSLASGSSMSRWSSHTASPTGCTGRSCAR